MKEQIDELIREYKEWGNKPIYGKVIQDLEQLKEQLKEQHKEDVINAYKTATIVTLKQVIRAIDENGNIPLESNEGEFAEQYYQQTHEKKCDCTHTQACIVCGEEKGLDGDFWRMLK